LHGKDVQVLGQDFGARNSPFVFGLGSGDLLLGLGLMEGSLRLAVLPNGRGDEAGNTDDEAR
jgi:hypothetical protein